MPKVNKAEQDLRTGDVSELVILTVLAALNTAPLPLILESLEIATKGALAPFSIGPSLEQVLKWRERLHEVEEELAGNQKMYRITLEGKDTVRHYDNFLRALFPSIVEVQKGGNELLQRP